jgi:hypothetical protein
MANERSFIEALVSAVVVVALSALAYSLGWLKMFFYFQVFGISLPELEIPIQNYLFESWYVIENLLFLLVMWWAVVRAKCSPTCKIVLWILAIVYSLIPLSAHYAYSYPGFAPALFLSRHEHSILKFAPFILIVGLVLYDFVLKKRGKEYRVLALRTPETLAWPYSKFSLVISLVIFVSFAISMAKHIGAADANRALRSRDEWLTRVTLHISSPTPELSGLAKHTDLYLIYASPSRYFLLDSSLFSGAAGRQVHVIVVPREKVDWIEKSYSFQVHPGSVYF